MLLVWLIYALALWTIQCLPSDKQQVTCLYQECKYSVSDLGRGEGAQKKMHRDWERNNAVEMPFH